MSDTFTKLPEDADGDGLTERPSVRWWLWLTDSGTVFVRGVLAGLYPGLGGAGIAVSFTDSTNPQTLAVNGATGFILGTLTRGLERFHFWQAKPENEMPNPFRSMPPSNTKAAERVAKLPTP